ncbi:MAG: hypothetical protein HY619_03050 [Thaumarchaeota archaeon]|nr:hypothetical protein [Nitrososphaerota archaeon]
MSTNWIEVLRTWAPIVISVVSLCIAAFSLGWNVYRDVVLKGRIRISLSIGNIVGPETEASPEMIFLSGVNLGPGKVTLDMIRTVTYKRFLRCLRIIERHSLVVNDYRNPMTTPLPSTVDVGQRFNVLLPYSKTGLLAQQFSRIGLGDSFGRAHWVSSKDLRRARRQHVKDFPS